MKDDIENDEDDSVFRHKVATLLKKMPNFHSLTEEYPVHIGQDGAVIDIIAKFNKHNKTVYFVIECKDYRNAEIVFPKKPIDMNDVYDWTLHYDFKDRDRVQGHSINLLRQKPIYYSTDICCKVDKTSTYNYEMFYRWARQTSSNFMAFAVEENKIRIKNPGTMEDFHTLPLMVCGSRMSENEAIIINPHPFNHEHLSIVLDSYIEPIKRGELKKHAFIIAQKMNLTNTIKGLLAEL